MTEVIQVAWVMLFVKDCHAIARNDGKKRHYEGMLMTEVIQAVWVVL